MSSQPDFHLISYPSYDFASDASSSQSAIFFHFCNCVWELIQETPFEFEFSDDLLIFLLDSLYDSRYGTFLYENESQRVKVRVKLKFIYSRPSSF